MCFVLVSVPAHTAEDLCAVVFGMKPACLQYTAPHKLKESLTYIISF